MKPSGIALPDKHIRVLYFGSRDMEAADRVTPRAPSWTLHWNRSSGATVDFGGKKHRLGPSKASLQTPYCSVHETLAQGEQHTYAHFSLGPERDRVSPALFVLSVDAPTRKLLHTVSTAYREKDALSPGDGFRVQAVLSLLLAQLPDSVWPKPVQDRRIRHVMNHIDRAFAARLNNTALAAQAQMSTNAFIRLFSQQVGRPPQRYLQQVRVEKAALQLLHTDSSIELIADRCGFCDRNYFSAVFRRQYGQGPAACRRQGSAPPGATFRTR